MTVTSIYTRRIRAQTIGTNRVIHPYTCITDFQLSTKLTCWSQGGEGTPKTPHRGEGTAKTPPGVEGTVGWDGTPGGEGTPDGEGTPIREGTPGGYFTIYWCRPNTSQYIDVGQGLYNILMSTKYFTIYWCDQVLYNILRRRPSTSKYTDVDQILYNILRCRPNTSKYTDVDHVLHKILRCRPNTSQYTDVDQILHNILRCRSSTSQYTDVDQILHNIAIHVLLSMTNDHLSQFPRLPQSELYPPPPPPCSTVCISPMSTRLFPVVTVLETAPSLISDITESSRSDQGEN